ncbi:MAG: hypothetical protein AAF253_01580 [Pseudomonadota bacterium]
MSGPGIVFVDANTIWHRRLADALGKVRPTLALLPKTDVFCRQNEAEGEPGETVYVSVGLPPGWASRTAGISQALLARRVEAPAKRFGGAVIILSSPAYAPLAERLSGRFPIVSYLADDYRSYTGWTDSARREKRLMDRATMRVFVSEALRARAVAEHGYPRETTFVSPNATERRFGPEGAGAERPVGLETLPRPILGVLGGVSTRLDLETIGRIAALPTVGTLLVAGPVDQALLDEQPWLRGPGVHITGRLPHDEMHRYAHAMDAALIPYAETPLNFHCSPMRLYDHLATGVPIYALPACGQIRSAPADGIVVGNADQLVAEISRELSVLRYHRQTAEYLWISRAEGLVGALDRMFATTERTQ